MGSAVVDFAKQVGLYAALMIEVTHAYAGKAYMHSFLPDVVEQLDRYRHKDVLVVGGMGESSLCRATAAVRVLKFERHRGAGKPLAAQATSDGFAQ